MSKNINQQKSLWQHGYFPKNGAVKRNSPSLQMQPQPNVSVATVNVSAQFFRALGDALMRTRNQTVTTMVNWHFNQFPFEQPANIILIDLDSFEPELADFLAKLSPYPRTRIILLGKNPTTDQIVDYYAGGIDDYIIKPCTHQEIALRIAVLIRRQTWCTARPQPSTLSMDRITDTHKAHEVDGNDYLIRLNPIEFQLLNAFMRKPNQPIKAEELFRQVWGYEVRGFQKLLDLAIRHLRQKVESANPSPGQIHAIDNMRYQFCPAETIPASSADAMLVYI